MIRLWAWVALWGVLCWTGAAEARTAPAQPVAKSTNLSVPHIVHWEYKVTIYNRVAVFGDSDHEMRLLGLMGWELVSTTYDPHARTIVCFYKRPIASVPAETVSPRP
jgi:hypothetical protein